MDRYLKYTELNRKAKSYAYRYAIGMTETEWADLCEKHDIRFNEKGIQYRNGQGDLITVEEACENQN